jgi:hypothetical protein
MERHMKAFQDSLKLDTNTNTCRNPSGSHTCLKDSKTVMPT